MVSHVYPPPISPRAGSVIETPQTGISPIGKPSSPPADAPSSLFGPTAQSPTQLLEAAAPLFEAQTQPFEPPVPTTGISPLSSGGAEPRVPIEPRAEADRFDFVAVDNSRATNTGGRGRKIAQGLIVLALVAIVGSLTFIIPESEGNLLASGPPSDDGSTRVEAQSAPIATASMLSASSRTVEGTLDSLASSGRLSGRSSNVAVAMPGTPGDSGDGFASAIAAVVETESPQQTTTTTTWVEPELPPASEWVDSGNGVMVPDLQLRIRFCESTNNYLAASPYSTARGAYQFLIGSWDWYGHRARTGVDEAHLATPAQQDESALLTLQEHGTGPWAESRGCWADPNIDSRYATAKPPTPAPSTTMVGAETTTTTPESTTTPDQSSTTEATTTTESTTTSESTTTTEATTTTTEASADQEASTSSASTSSSSTSTSAPD